MFITLHQVRSHPAQWIDTSYLRSDGKIEYRERKEFGNRHAVFERGQTYGAIHHDRYNATDFPAGTVRHASRFIEEKTGIPERVTTAAISGVAVGALAYAIYRICK